MDFIKDAETSHSRIICRTIRSVLYECAAGSLRQMIRARTEPLSTSKNQTQQQEEEQRQIQITQEDIDLSYQLARNVGRRWADKLSMTDDDANIKFSALVELVLCNGEFLDLSYRDDLTQLESTSTFGNRNENAGVTASQRRGGGGGKDEGNLLASEESSDDDSDIPTAGQNPTNYNNNQQLQQPQDSSNDPKLSTLSKIKKSIPYATLLNIGQLDPCNLMSSTDLQQGTSDEWHPLPSLPSSSLVHFPKPTILPEDQIQRIDESQLFGRPALKMPPKLNCKEQASIIDDLAYDITGNHGRDQELGHTMWPFGWDVVQRQAEKNHGRLHPLKIRKGQSANGEGEEEFMEVIPRSLLRGETADDIDGAEDDDTGDHINGRDNNFITSPVADDEPLFVTASESGGVQRLSVTKGFQKTSASTKVMRTWDSDEESDSNNVESVDAQTSSNENAPVTEESRVVGKKPSPFGTFQWTIQDIRNNLGQDLRENLEKTMIHGDDESQRELQTCQGALKSLGNVHLFEQIRSKKWKGVTDDIPHGDDESDDEVGKEEMKARKAAHRMAKRQRLYPNYELGTKGYQDKLKSKVMRVNEGKEGCRPLRVHDDYQSLGNKCIELDLGECVCTFFTASEGAPPVKKTLAFRSLEVSLLEP